MRAKTWNAQLAKLKTSENPRVVLLSIFRFPHFLDNSGWQESSPYRFHQELCPFSRSPKESPYRIQGSTGSTGSMPAGGKRSLSPSAGHRVAADTAKNLATSSDVIGASAEKWTAQLIQFLHIWMYIPTELGHLWGIVVGKYSIRGAYEKTMAAHST